MMRNKKISIAIAFVVISFALATLFACSSAKVETSPAPVLKTTLVPNTPTSEPAMDIFKKPLITNMYTADPSAHVFAGKLYIYPSHDLNHDNPPTQDGDQYDMEDYHVFSMEDMHSLPVDHGEVLNVKNVPWATKQMWAAYPPLKNDPYSLSFPAGDKDPLSRIGVAPRKSPAGPFTPEPNYIQ